MTFEIYYNTLHNNNRKCFQLKLALIHKRLKFKIYKVKIKIYFIIL